MPKPCEILVINPGSTSTKVSRFIGSDETAGRTMCHSASILASYPKVIDQESLRFEAIERFVAETSRTNDGFSAVVGRGGLLRPVEGGVYAVDETMLTDLRRARFGEHASNLGAILAHRFASRYGCPAYIVDPVVVDELEERARITGLPGIRRRSIFHALNQRAAARRVAAALGKPYGEINLIVAHLGGGVTVGAHRQGRVIDVNNGLDGDGPFSAERSGTLPAGDLVTLALNRGLSESEVRKQLTGGGGFVAHFGTNDLRELRTRERNGDARIHDLLEAFALRVGQEIARHGATLAGEVDAIVLTGGMVADHATAEAIGSMVSYLAPVHLVPGELEMEALAEGALSVQRGMERAKPYR